MNDYTTAEPQPKHCPKCEQDKPATSDNFARDKSCQDGLDSRCKACRHQGRMERKEKTEEYNRLYRSKNADNIRGQEKVYRSAHRKEINESRRCYESEHKQEKSDMDRRYREKNKGLLAERGKIKYAENKVRISEKGRAYRAKNKYKKTESGRIYYRKNKARIAEQGKLYRADNKELAKASRNRRRARLREAQGTHTAGDVKKQYDSQRGRCYWCSIKLDNHYHCDHIIPLSRGGSNGPENICCSCPPCNLSKHNKLPTEWDGSNRLL